MKLRPFMRDFPPGFSNFIRLFGFALLFGLSCTAPRMYVQPEADFTFIKKVAILPFENLTADKFAGEKIRDIVTTEVLSRGYFDVVEKGEVNRVLKEEGLASATSLSNDAAMSIGKRLGVQAFIMGSVEEYGTTPGAARAYPNVAITMRMIAADTGKILWHVSYSKTGGNILNQLFGINSKSISEIARELVKEMMDTLFKKNTGSII